MWLRLARATPRNCTTAKSSARRAFCGLNLETLEARDVPAVAFQFDYSFDTSGFFNDTGRRAVLEQAANDLGSQLTTTLPALAPSSGNTWTASFYNPANGQYTSVSNPTIPANTIRVYVGGRAVSGSEAGFGGSGGYSASGSQSFLDQLKTRWSGGFTMWGGSVAFDSTENWYYGSSAAGIATRSVTSHLQRYQFAFPNSIGSCRGPRTVPSDHVTRPAGSSLKSGMRFSHSSIATVISMRARLEPTQRWMPRPKAA